MARLVRSPRGSAPGTRRSVPRLFLALGCTLVLLVPLPAFASADPLFANQWSLTQSGAAAAWSTSTGAGVLIGVVDTGIDLEHPDLAGQVVDSTNCIGARGNPADCAGSGQDDNGHGTHVSGIIAARKDNNVGVAGVAPSSRLLVAKALDAGGAGNASDIQAGIKWVVDRGAKVVNLSLGNSPGLLGSSGISPELADGINYAWDRGAIPVLAAGNYSGDPVEGLGRSVLGGLLGTGTSTNFANLPAVIVGATERSGNLASYSGGFAGARWALVAPGGSNNEDPADSVLSTYWRPGQTNQYASLGGTSMAAAYVAGALADVIATGLGPEDAINRILSTASRGTACSAPCAGLVDVSSAVGQQSGSRPQVPTAAVQSRNPLAMVLGLLGL